MNAIHPTFQAALQAITPPTDERVPFAVKLVFSDGVYENRAWAASAERAIALATMDARMASPYNTFYGELLHKEAVPA